MKIYQILLMLVVVVTLLVRDSWAYPQEDGAIRGRAVSSYNKNNDADDEDEEPPPPRKNGRRAFVSKCRCSTLSNCPKLQISIARCSPGEFVCCFK